MAKRLNLRCGLESLRHEARECPKPGDNLCSLRFAQPPPINRRLDGKDHECCQLAGEGLCGGHADLRAREGRKDDIGLPRDGAFGDIYDPECHRLLARSNEGRQRIGRLTGLADEDRERVRPNGGSRYRIRKPRRCRREVRQSVRTRTGPSVQHSALSHKPRARSGRIS